MNEIEKLESRKLIIDALQELYDEEDRLTVSPIIFDTGGKNGIFAFVPAHQTHTLITYDRLSLPQELIERFDFWYEWYSKGISDKNNKMDIKLYNSYGMALAVDMKLFLDKMGSPYDVYFDGISEPMVQVMVGDNKNYTNIYLAE